MVRDEEVFGSPVKSSGKVVAKKTGVAATTRRKKPVAAGKENAEVEEAGTIKAKVAGRAAGTRRKVAAVAAVAAGCLILRTFGGLDSDTERLGWA
jgi:hypothetical protein